MKDLSGKTIIVTGGAGFIGSNLVSRLARDNKVVVIDNLHTGSLKNIEGDVAAGNTTFIKDDVKNISKHGIKADIVFHLGMYSSSPMYRENRSLTSEVVEGMVQVLNYVKDNNARLVFACTSSNYNGIETPWREDAAPLPVTEFYVEARIACERLAQLYNSLYGVNAIGARFFSVYGWREETKGEYANLVSQFLWLIKKGGQPVIWGDGEQKRDFVFVDDVVEALINCTNIDGFDIFNVGTGKAYTLNEVVSKLNAALGKDVKPRYVKLERKNYLAETLADTEKSERVLGFKARISLDDGIRMLAEGKK